MRSTVEMRSQAYGAVIQGEFCLSSPSLLSILSAVLRWSLHEPAKEADVYRGFSSLAWHVCTGVSDENIVTICVLCDCLEDQPASFIVSFI